MVEGVDEPLPSINEIVETYVDVRHDLDDDESRLEEYSDGYILYRTYGVKIAYSASEVPKSHIEKISDSDNHLEFTTVTDFGRATEQFSEVDEEIQIGFAYTDTVRDSEIAPREYDGSESFVVDELRRVLDAEESRLADRIYGVDAGEEPDSARVYIDVGTGWSILRFVSKHPELEVVEIRSERTNVGLAQKQVAVVEVGLGTK